MKVVGEESLTPDRDQVKKLVRAQMKHMKYFDFDITEVLPNPVSREFAGDFGVST